MKRAYVKPELRKSAVLSNVTANGAGSLKAISDVRLKTDIEKVGVAAKVDQGEPPQGKARQLARPPLEGQRHQTRMGIST